MEAQGFLLIIFMVLAYLFPYMVASWRNHHQLGAIFTLNLLLGWTFIGWVIALVWAATAVQGQKGGG